MLTLLPVRIRAPGSSLRQTIEQQAGKDTLIHNQHHKMPNLINNLSLQWDLWIGPFRAFFPSGKEDLLDCQEVYREAGIRELSENKHTKLAACQDTRTGKIIACMRVADARLAKKKPQTMDYFSFDLFEDSRLAGMALFTHLAVSEDYEKTQAPIVLINHCFIEILKGGGLAALMPCNLDYFSRYKRLGMRPVGHLQKTPEEEYRIPMIFLPDFEYLSIINSPTLPLLRGVEFDRYQEIVQWYYQLVREHIELQTGSAFFPENQDNFEGHHSITEGLSEKGRETFLKDALVINCREGEVLITENDGGKSFGFVRRGLVKVMIGSKTVVQLGEGDIFGEIAYVLNSKRTAQVVAASPNTEVVLFSENAIVRLEDERDRSLIWRNLARVLAQRVVLTNKLLG